jgi:stress-induced morphogen
LNPEWIREKIVAQLPDADIVIVDLTGTGDHFEASVVSVAFVGKGLVQQHQLVYACLQEKLSTGELHALKLKTKAK